MNKKSASLLTCLVAAIGFLSSVGTAQTFDLDRKDEELNAPQQARQTRSDLPSTSHLPKLSVIVPVFNPNIGTKAKDDVWPEIRRAEANRFAVLTRRALQDTGAFGAVRVMPDDSSFGELYVHGTILKANTEDVKLRVVVNDIRGKSTKTSWMDKTFEYRVPSTFHNSLRQGSADAYGPIFDEIAAAIVGVLARKKAIKMEQLQAITDMRFASLFAPEYFTKYLKKCERKCKLVSLPAENDPVYQRVQTLRLHEQMFVDQFQRPYDDFYDDMTEPYSEWQEYAYPIAVEERKEKARANTRAFLGLLVAAGGVASGNDDLAIAGGVAGTLLVVDAVNKYRSSNASGEALNEMGQTLNLDLSEQVVQFEDIETELQGDAVEQFIGFRQHLAKIYEAEYTPTSVQLD